MWRTVFRLVSNRDDAHDCYQETFLQAAAYASKHMVANWPALLKRIATGRALDCLRQRYRTAARSAPLEAAAACATPGPTPAAQAELREAMHRLRRALTLLPDQQSEVFWLREVELMSTADVADELQVTPDQVATWLHRAKRRLREVLAENGRQSEMRR